VFFDGQVDLTRHDEAEIAMMGIGRKFQKPTVFESHSVEDNLMLALKGPRSIFPDATNPRVVLTAWTGDLGMDDGTAQSVYVLDTSRMTQLRQDGRPFTLSSLAVAAISRSRTRKRSLLCASNNGKVGADLVIPDGRVLADAATICLSESGQRFPARALLR